MTSYCIAEVPKALGNKNWSSPIIIVPPHYFLSKPDGQYVKYLRPPWTPESTSLLKDFIVNHPHAKPPVDWDDIKVNLKSANSYQVAQSEGLTYAREAINALRREQNASSKPEKGSHQAPNKKLRTTLQYPANVTSISSFINQECSLPMASTPVLSDSVQNCQQAVPSNMAQEPDATFVNDIGVPQGQTPLDQMDLLEQAILLVPGMDVGITETVETSGDVSVEESCTLEHGNATRNKNPGHEKSELQVFAGIPESNSAPSTVDPIDSSLISNGDGSISYTETQENSMDSAYLSASSPLFASHTSMMDSPATKQDLRDMGNTLMLRIGEEINHCLNIYHEMKCGKQLESVIDNLEEIKNIAMKSVPVVELSDAIPLEDLKTEFNSKLPMTTEGQFLKFVLDALRWIADSWDEIPTSTIQKCFKRAGFPVDSMSIDSSDGASDVDCNDVIPCLPTHVSDDLLSIDDQLDLEAQMTVHENGPSTSEEVFESLFQEAIASEDESDDEYVSVIELCKHHHWGLSTFTRFKIYINAEYENCPALSTLAIFKLKVQMIGG
ncbi:hypothetical protein QAD02_018401 [Eretmocerus hayati]|uniref:Uncharacterized protein n=1 Tax=Eretmocerus hayati TaxID=131215 RepID=A0ACC2PJ40_9HYME|nr:hypothetical protein QAD02_018401 [Eretmocerus hayati]